MFVHVPQRPVLITMCLQFADRAWRIPGMFSVTFEGGVQYTDVEPSFTYRIPQVAPGVEVPVFLVSNQALGGNFTIQYSIERTIIVAKKQALS